MAAADRKRLNQLMKKASMQRAGCPVDTVEVVGDRRVMARLSSLMNLPPHAGRSRSSAAPSATGWFLPVSEERNLKSFLLLSGCTTNCRRSWRSWQTQHLLSTLLCFPIVYLVSSVYLVF